MQGLLSGSLLAFASLALAAPTSAQDICEGNGLGSAYISHSEARLGDVLEIDIGSPTQPGGLGWLSLSGGPGPSLSPLSIVGLVCLDVDSFLYRVIAYSLDGTGNKHLSFNLPTNPAFVSFPLFYANAAVFEPGLPLLSMSKTVNIAWQNDDGYNPTGSLGTARAAHTATSLAADAKDNRTKVLVAGGGGGTLLAPTATDTTEIYSPIFRTYTAGPTMSAERSFHASVRLPNGKVLITGGLDSSGVVNTSCDLYDGDTDTITPTGSMNFPRTGHGITLLDNGKVLVTGGLSDYVDAENRFITVMSSALAGGELYDPSTGTWTIVPSAMQTKRAGHTQTKLDDGTVLIVAGANGAIQSVWAGEVPTFAVSVDYYDPVANAFSPAPPIPVFATGSFGFHAASLLPSGDVLVTGGLTSDTTFGNVDAISSTYIFDGTAWTQGLFLLDTRFLHQQLVGENGSAIVMGGFTGSYFSPGATAAVEETDGVTSIPRRSMGIESGIPGSTAVVRGNLTVTRLYDGSALVVGGADSVGPQTDSFSFVE